MSDYYGDATLEDWLAEEVFSVAQVPPAVVSLFEPWRSTIEHSIQSWMNSNVDGEGGRASWRAWGQAFPADDAEFDKAVVRGREILSTP